MEVIGILACLALYAVANMEDERDEDEPKPGPCPFCDAAGNKVSLRSVIGLRFVGCRSCWATGPRGQKDLPVRTQRKQAVILWNRAGMRDERQ